MIRIEVPRSLWLNANDREHWRPRARKTKALRTMGHGAAAFSSERYERAELNINVGWPDERRRDDANYHPMYKALVDGMVDGGVLSDDSRKQLVGPFPRSHVAGIKGVVVLEFEFREVGA